MRSNSISDRWYVYERHNTYHIARYHSGGPAARARIFTSKSEAQQYADKLNHKDFKALMTSQEVAIILKKTHCQALSLSCLSFWGILVETFTAAFLRNDPEFDVDEFHKECGVPID